MAYTAYPVSGFDAISSGLSMLGTDVQNYQKQQRLADLGQKIQAGDIPGAAKIAFDAGDPATGLKLMTLGLQQKASAGAAPVLGMPLEYPGDTSAPAASPSTGAQNSSYTGGPLPVQLSAGVDPNNMDPASPVIASMEGDSRGYKTVGVPTSDGDRAYGLHGVMGKNVGPWTKEVLGQEMTPEQFLANPFAQERVFAQKFNEYRLKYGDSSTAAQAWFAGPGGVGTGRTDPLGTSVPQYAATFKQRNQIAPSIPGEEAGGTQVASADNAFVPTGSGAVAADDANAGRKKWYNSAVNDTLQKLAVPNLDSDTKTALLKKLEIYNQKLKDIRDEENKAVTTVGKEEFATAFPGQTYPQNAIVQKDAAGKYSVARLDNERVPNLSAQADQRTKILVDQGIDPKSPQGQEYILNGKVPEVGAMKATEQKMFAAAQDKVLTLQQSIADLEKAKQLNPQAYSGNYQPGAAAFIHRNVPGGDMLVDPNRVTATTQFENLVTGANAALGKEMFGARVTNYDEQILQRLRANPRMGADERAALLDQMIQHRKETLGQVQSEVSQMKAGTRFQRDPNARQPQQGQQPQAADVLSQARDAIARGADRSAVIQRLQQNGVDASGL